MRANFERIVDASASAGQSLIGAKQSKISNQLVLAISCVGRRLLLGERTEEEVEVIFNEFDKDSLLAGFYSYGELAPTENGEVCALHNQTMTLFSISENVAQSKKIAI